MAPLVAGRQAEAAFRTVADESLGMSRKRGGKRGGKSSDIGRKAGEKAGKKGGKRRGKRGFSRRQLPEGEKGGSLSRPSRGKPRVAGRGLWFADGFYWVGDDEFVGDVFECVAWEFVYVDESLVFGSVGDRRDELEAEFLPE